MKIAFYLDTPQFTAIAEKAIAAAREAMPQAEIWHLTTEDGPQLSADREIRADVGDGFASRRAIMSAMMTGDVLHLDCDCIVREDVSSVFEDTFDIAVTTDMRPGAGEIKYNAGVVFSRRPSFWGELAEKVQGLGFQEWRKTEGTFNELADNGRFKTKVLDGERFNYVPLNLRSLQQSNAAIVHYRGGRKRYIR